MSKKFGKFIIFAATASAVYGTCHYLKTKKGVSKDSSIADDDTDDFYDFEDFDEENLKKQTHKERSYISLDQKMNFSNAKESAKEVLDNVSEKLGTVAAKVVDITKSSIHTFEHNLNNHTDKETFTETIINDLDETDDFAESMGNVNANPIEKTEEFFNDEKDEEKGTEQIGWENL